MRRTPVRLAALLLVSLFAAGALSVATASSASAGCTLSIYYKGDQGQVDACPGNGAASWGWVWNGTYNNRSAFIQVEDYAGTIREIYAGNYGETSSWNLPTATWRFRVCNSYIPRGASTDCSWWATF